MINLSLDTMNFQLLFFNFIILSSQKTGNRLFIWEKVKYKINILLYSKKILNKEIFECKRVSDKFYWKFEIDNKGFAQGETLILWFIQ